MSNPLDPKVELQRAEAELRRSGGTMFDHKQGSPDDVDFFDTMYSMWRQESPVINIARLDPGNSDQFNTDPTFRLPQAIEESGMQRHSVYLSKARNKDQFDQMVARLAEDEHDQLTMANSPLWANLVSGFSVGILGDPTVLIPGLNVAKGVKGMRSAIKAGRNVSITQTGLGMAIETGFISGSSQAVSEAVALAAHPLRTYEQAEMGTIAAGIMGFALGGIAGSASMNSALKKMEMAGADVVLERVKKDLQGSLATSELLMHGPYKDGSTVGAQAAKGLDDFVSDAADIVRERQKTEDIDDPLLAYQRALVDIINQELRSGDPAQRKAIVQGFITREGKMKDVADKATRRFARTIVRNPRIVYATSDLPSEQLLSRMLFKQTISRRGSLDMAKLGDTWEVSNEALFLESASVANSVQESFISWRAKDEPLSFRGKDIATDEDFYEAVGNAAHFGAEGAPEDIANASARVNAFIDKIDSESRDWGVLPMHSKLSADGVDDATRYAPLMYNLKRIAELEDMAKVDPSVMTLTDMIEDAVRLNPSMSIITRRGRGGTESDTTFGFPAKAETTRAIAEKIMANIRGYGTPSGRRTGAGSVNVLQERELIEYISLKSLVDLGVVNTNALDMLSHVQQKVGSRLESVKKFGSQIGDEFWNIRPELSKKYDKWKEKGLNEDEVFELDILREEALDYRSKVAFSYHGNNRVSSVAQEIQRDINLRRELLKKINKGEEGGGRLAEEALDKVRNRLRDRREQGARLGILEKDPVDGVPTVNFRKTVRKKIDAEEITNPTFDPRRSAPTEMTGRTSVRNVRTGDTPGRPKPAGIEPVEAPRAIDPPGATERPTFDKPDITGTRQKVTSDVSGSAKEDPGFTFKAGGTERIGSYGTDAFDEDAVSELMDQVVKSYDDVYRAWATEAEELTLFKGKVYEDIHEMDISSEKKADLVKKHYKRLDRLKAGMYNEPLRDPHLWYNKVTDFLMNWQYFRIGGGFALAALADPVGQAFAHGLGPTMNAWHAILKNRKLLDGLDAKGARVLELANTARLMDLNEVAGSGSVAEFTNAMKGGTYVSTDTATGKMMLAALDNPALKALGIIEDAGKGRIRVNGYSKWTMLNQVSSVNMGAATISAADNILTQGRKLIDGGTPPPAMLREMADEGVSAQDLKEFYVSWAKHGGETDGKVGVQLSNWDKWDDDVLAMKFHKLVIGQSQRGVFTSRIGDRPFFMDEGLVRIFGQFLSFGIVAADNIVLGSLSRGLDPRTAQGALTGLLWGSVVAGLREVGRDIGRPEEMFKGWKEAPATFIWDAIDQSGMLGILGNGLGALEKGTGIGVHRFLGGEGASRFRARGTAESIAGPVVGTGADTLNLISDTFRGEWNAGTTNSARRLWPTQNWTPARPLYDVIQDAFNAYFNFESNR